MNEAEQKVQAGSKLQDSPVTCVQVNEKITTLVASVKAIMAKPVPEPKKEEKVDNDKEPKEEDIKDQENLPNQNLDEKIDMDVE